MDKQREDTLAELEVALQELESDEGLTRFVAGHVIASWTPIKSKSTPATTGTDLRRVWRRHFPWTEGKSA
jgi:hypothetical protein